MVMQTLTPDLFTIQEALSIAIILINEASVVILFIVGSGVGVALLNLLISKVRDRIHA